MYVCISICLSSFHPVMSVDVTYGWTQTSHHNALHTCQCPTPLQPKRTKNTETSQQCINNTGFSTVWPSEHTQTGCLLPRNVMGFLWDVCFGPFWRCSLGRRCHQDRDSLTKMSPKMGFKGVDLAALKGPWVTFLFFRRLSSFWIWMCLCLPSSASLSSQPICVFVRRSRMVGRLPCARSWKLATSLLT